MYEVIVEVVRSESGQGYFLVNGLVFGRLGELTTYCDVHFPGDAIRYVLAD